MLKLTPSPVLPSLSPVEYEALKTSILEHGILVPLLATDRHVIVDGHERYRAIQELGLRTFPVRVLGCVDEGERRFLAVRSNVERRHLTVAERRALLASVVLANPARSTRELADCLKVGKSTVSRVRAEALAGVPSGTPRAITGRDGKRYPYRPAYSAETAMQAREGARLLTELGADAPHGASLRALRKAAWERRAQADGEGPEAKLPPTVEVVRSCFRSVEDQVGDLAGRADLCLLDPPWSSSWYDNLPDLAAKAAGMLKSGGICCCYVGQGSLPAVLGAFTNELSYRWIITCENVVRAGRTQARCGGSIKSLCRTVLVFSKGPFKPYGVLTDFLRVAGAEDERYLHPLNFQQPASEAEYLVARCTRPGPSLTVDLACGAGTVGVAVVRAGQGRRAILCDVDEDCVRIARKRISEASGIA